MLFGPGEVLCDVYTQELVLLTLSRSHHWWSEEHAESALSWSQRQSPSSSPHSREIVVTAPPRPAAHLAPVSFSQLCCWWDPPSRVIANLMKRWSCVTVVQSWVSRVKRRGLSTHPWGPLCSVWWCWMFTADPYCLRSPGQKSNSQLHSDVWAPAGPVYGWAVEDDCVECWTEIYEQQSDIRVRFV